MISLFFYCFEL